MASRVDRKNRPGGGVLIICRKELSFIPRPDLGSWEESAWIELQVHSHLPKSLIIGCLYRPPDQDPSIFAEKLESALDQINLSHTHLVLVGDFNARSPSWCSTDRYNPAGKMLEQTFLQLGLHQMVDTPTHLSNDGSIHSLLDLVLVSSANFVSKITTLPPLGSSDHLAVFCSLKFSPTRSRRGRTRTIWNYKKADFEKINKLLSDADWSDVSSAPNIDEAWSSWQSRLLSIVRKEVPSKTIANVKPKKPYLTPDIERAIKEKHSALRMMKKNPQPTTDKPSKPSAIW